MKYIITEEQYKRLDEISVYEGGLPSKESFESTLVIIIDEIGNKKFKQEVKNYLKGNIGEIPKKEYRDYSFKEYSKHLRYGYGYDEDKFPIELMNKDVLSHMAYFMAKKFLKIKKLGSLECYIRKTNFGKEYLFFDPEIQMSVGSIYLAKFDDHGFNSMVKFPSNSWSVAMSNVDKEIKGSGTGKAMYLSVLDDVDVLFSDTTLYFDSLNIWVNVLPKLTNVYALSEGSQTKPKRILSGTKVLNHGNVRRYFATKNPKLIKMSS